MSKTTAPRPSSQGRYNKKPKRSNSFSYTNPNPKLGKGEKKNLDLNNPTTINFGNATALVTLINGCAQGVGDSQRVGRSVMLKSIQWRWTGVLAPTTTGASALRMIIVYDKQPSGIVSIATDIMTINSIESPMLLANSKRFTVIADEIVECVGTQGPQAWYSKGYRKLSLPQEFIGTSALISSISVGAIYTLFYSQGTLLVANPVSQCYTRIRYHDA